MNDLYVLCVKAGFLANKQPGIRASAVAGAKSSVAARPEPAPTLVESGEKNQPRTVGFLIVVEVSGIEPLASTLRTSRSPN